MPHPVNRRLGRRLLAGLEEPLFGLETRDLAPAPLHGEDGAQHVLVRVGGGGRIHERQLVGADDHRLSSLERRRDILLKTRGAGDTGEDEDHPHVDDISAVTALVPPDEGGETDGEALLRHRLPRPRAPVKLDDDRPHDEDAQSEGGEGEGLPHAEGEEGERCRGAREDRPGEVHPEIFRRSTPPRDEGAHSGEEE